MTIVLPSDCTLIAAGTAPLTVAEFLAWDGFDPNHHYQLIDGAIVMMMAPALGAHNILIGALAETLRVAARPMGLRVVPVGGVARSQQAKRWFEADLIVTAEPPDRRFFSEPVLVAEVLSPSTENLDRTVKLPDYRAISSVRDILLIDPSQPLVEHHWRPASGAWTTTLLTSLDAVVDLAAIPLRLPLAQLYEGIPLGPEPSPSTGPAQ